MSEDSRELTRLEHAIDAAATRWLSQKPESGPRAALIECLVFVLKQAWELVSPQKLVAWLLLMIISVVMVTWVYPAKPLREAP